MKRRGFIALLGVTDAWPRVACAQRINRIPRVGVLRNLSAGDPEGKTRIAAFGYRKSVGCSVQTPLALAGVSAPTRSVRGAEPQPLTRTPLSK
jgi:hypothetical protein